MSVNHRQIRSILVIKLRAIGDVLLSTVVTKNLRLAFPGARIDYLTEPPGADVLRGNPYVDQVHLHDRARHTGIRLIRAMRYQRYDMVIDLFGNPRTALLTLLSGARYRIGYRFGARRYAYTTVVEPRGGLVHNTQFNLDALEAIGVAIQDRNIYFPLAHEDVAHIDGILRASGLERTPLIGVNAGGGWKSKRWGLEKFAELSDRMADDFHATIVLPWGPGERSDAERIQALMKREKWIPPATTLKQLGALLKRCAFVVSNDSGPMHIAAAVGTPVLGIYGPTNPDLQGPYGPPHLTIVKHGLTCLGCDFTECPIDHPCMRELTVEEVMNSVRQLVARNNLFT